MLSVEDFHRLNAMTRREMIDEICSCGYITTVSHPGQYVFGETKDGRSACLIWRDHNNGQATLTHYAEMIDEITQAGLKIPFLLFGVTALFDMPSCEFLQVPSLWESRDVILRTLQRLNMQRTLRLVSAQRDV